MNFIRTNSLQKIADVVLDFSAEQYAQNGFLALQEYGRFVNVESWPDYVKIFIKTDLVPQSISFLKELKSKFHLLTGASDICINEHPDVVSEILSYTKIVSWVGNNLDEVDPKMLSIPIGFPRSEIAGNTSIAAYFIKPSKKKIHILMTWNGDTSPKRKALKDLIAQDIDKRIFVQTQRLNFEGYVQQLNESVYVICPQGNGIDTHRVYETILSDSIPVVLKSPLWKMHREIGCIILNNWSEVFHLPLNTELKIDKSKALSLSAWSDKIYAHQKQFER
jgi:hypothetical protein